MINFNFKENFFDTLHSRENTGSVKYNLRGKILSEELIPMWIADMDFQSPPAVIHAMTAVSEHGIFGYTDTDESYDAALCNWYYRRMGWKINPSWNIKTPGIMFGIAASLRALTEQSDSVLICQPVYYPFAKIILSNKRQPVVSELRLIDGRYEFDFEDIERKIVSNSIKLFLLCSPHNPVGRVWTRKELQEIGRICVKHGVYIVSDEIHSDFIYDGNNHIPIASVSDEVSERTITCTSPTKTFNLAGLQAANILVANEALRNKIQEACLATGYSYLNTMAIAATKAAYQHGEVWLNELLAYLQGNITILRNALLKLSGISLIQPEGTYLIWLDCRKLGLTAAELETLFLEKAGVWLHNGSTFGSGGSGFMRMNIACPSSVLITATRRIFQALKSITIG
ncbi:cystathionine beta-lyase [Ruminiclostridium sufflavum DSM 19573]|uniref:cysteine-S-conjugate beta-lyase n=1 Tax=Ruminiclostridium sufflavum DSM 19573 TaxID=1121337 RepID=A0A318XSB5_9FIRM|nr:MalY/PatB family protein [Ruminiclostridium sufflavum]PYG89464.1 cystathionine beta-lyase [Ruminiclostridium sufflavum DSM 19573]